MAEAPWRQTAAPPPPPGAVGHLPATRLKSDISDRRVEPPLCVQNAMLTKDKKPFTYTPGGIDLSEIRSPRMQRRLEMNAMNEGVSPVPQAQPNYPTGPLPPSALAAMQPQLSVQVFPAGGIPQPHHHGGAPPPPPPPSGIPPPPKAPPPPMRPTSPLPTDAFDRPDMTKIIPENPMAMLRKTSGPVIKRDPIFNKDTYGGPNVRNGVDAPPRPVLQPVRQPESPHAKTTTGLGSIYVPPVNQNATPPTPPQRHPQSPQFVNQAESPTANRVAPPYYKRQPSAAQPEPQSPPTVIQRQPPVAAAVAQRDPQTPDSPKATLSKAPTPWLQKRQTSQDVPEWAINDNRGQISPPVEEQFQQKVQIQQEAPQKQQSRPWMQQQQQQQPQQLAQQPPWQQQQQQVQQQQQQQQPDAQPWQQRQKQQPELQPWQQRQQQQQPEAQQPWQQQQSRPAQSPPVQIPQGGGVRKQVQNRQQPQESGPVQRTEVVIVNEPPQVFQHPGSGQPQQRIIIRQQQPQQNNNYQQQQQGGARIIPVQVEGASSNGQVRSPNTPGSDARSLNRPLSWNSTPTQSNTFRVLQKITQTDGDDDDDQPVIEHSPKTPQNFPQRQLSTEQIRKIKQNEGDQELMNKFKQGLDQGSSLHNEVDPRYRGPNIPSKAFKLLQNMTGGPDEPPSSSTVPQNQQSNNRGPKVRTIPIQIEGDGPTKTYVPPSEQTVPEPKKYMGSSIPSRSFKILQAMTGPDDCGPGQSDL